MADHTNKEHAPVEVCRALSKAIQDQIAEYERDLSDLRQRELRKNSAQMIERGDEPSDMQKAQSPHGPDTMIEGKPHTTISRGRNPSCKHTNLSPGVSCHAAGYERKIYECDDCGGSFRQQKQSIKKGEVFIDKKNEADGNDSGVPGKRMKDMGNETPNIPKPKRVSPNKHEDGGNDGDDIRSGKSGGNMIPSVAKAAASMAKPGSYSNCKGCGLDVKHGSDGKHVPHSAGYAGGRTEACPNTPSWKDSSKPVAKSNERWYDDPKPKRDGEEGHTVPKYGSGDGEHMNEPPKRYRNPNKPTPTPKEPLDKATVPMAKPPSGGTGLAPKAPAMAKPAAPAAGMPKPAGGMPKPPMIAKGGARMDNPTVDRPKPGANTMVKAQIPGARPGPGTMQGDAMSASHKAAQAPAAPARKPIAIPGRAAALASFTPAGQFTPAGNAVPQGAAFQGGMYQGKKAIVLPGKGKPAPAQANPAAAHLTPPPASVRPPAQPTHFDTSYQNTPKPMGKPSAPAPAANPYVRKSESSLGSCAFCGDLEHPGNC